MRSMPVFPQIDALPGAQGTTAGPDRQCQAYVRQHAPDVRRHVVWSFIRMAEQGVAVGRQPRHEAFEILAHRRICVLRNHQRCARVLQEQMAQPGPDAGVVHGRVDQTGDFNAAATACKTVAKAFSSNPTKRKPTA